ncbi:hypothetical protein NECID01_1487 [Nematocida sp. AWRm77]|nr:hypothetical protein NECID01_1487 [Nematocida sp. AWRm77]
MNKTSAYSTLCTLTMFCLCTAIEVKFKLGSGKENLTCTVPEGAFSTIDSHKTKCGSLFAKNGQARTGLKVEEKCEIPLSYIRTPAECKHFNAFWETDLAALPEEEDNALSQYQIDLTQSLFDSFLLTANYLKIQGEHAQLFITNMVRYGFLGKYAKDITDYSLCQNNNIPYSTFQPILSTFLRLIGFEYRAILHPSTKKKMLLIEKDGVWPKKINNECTVPSQTARIWTVLYSKLGAAASQEKERNEAVLGWLLSSIGGSFVDIQYSTSFSSEDLYELKNTIQNLTKENEKGKFVCVKGVMLDIDWRHHPSLFPALQLVPDLFRLELSIDCDYIFNVEISSLFTTICLCKSLKVLKIRGVFLENVVIRRLLKSLPIIEQLSLSCKILEDRTICDLKKCARLENLELVGIYQPSAVVKTLITALSFLKILAIECHILGPAAAESFQACTQLERLEIRGELQPSAVVQALVIHLSPLKRVRINCDVLEPAAAESFKVCKHLESLEIRGELQTSPLVQELIRHLSSLRELWIMCDVLEPDAAETFQACTQLEKLGVFGKGNISFLVKLLEALPSLQDLRIEVDTAHPSLAIALWKCHKLCSLELAVRRYYPGFLEYYMSAPLPSLIFLEVYNYDRNNNYSEQDKSAVEKASAMISIRAIHYSGSKQTYPA